jgi:hypothetical protein
MSGILWKRAGFILIITQGEIIMAGRFGKYGDLKRKAALRKSRIQKVRSQKNTIPKTVSRRKKRNEKLGEIGIKP